MLGLLLCLLRRSWRVLLEVCSWRGKGPGRTRVLLRRTARTDVVNNMVRLQHVFLTDAVMLAVRTAIREVFVFLGAGPPKPLPARQKPVGFQMDKRSDAARAAFP